MNKMRSLIIGLTIVSLVAVGLVAVAGNGYSASTDRASRQVASGDCDLSERVLAHDGTGFAKSQGSGSGLRNESYL